MSMLTLAPPLYKVVSLIKTLLKDYLLVGHSIGGDLQMLGIDPTSLFLRKIPVTLFDTATFQEFKQTEGGTNLKNLSSKLLGRSIQSSKRHDPVEDAQAAMDLYMRCVQG
jgi:DNA polymerase III epsilon subunit-like protein